MHVDAAERQPGIGEDLLGELLGPLDIHPEFVPLFARRGLGVRLGVDVGIEPQGDRPHHPLASRDAGNGIQLGFTLDIEHQHVVVEGEGDFLIGFPHPGEDHLAGVGPRLLHAVQLPSRDHVEARPGGIHHLQNAQIRVGLHRIANHRVHGRESLLNLRQVMQQGPLRIDVERGAVLGRQIGHAGLLAVQLAVLVVKEVHGGMTRRCGGKEDRESGRTDNWQRPLLACQPGDTPPSPRNRSPADPFRWVTDPARACSSQPRRQPRQTTPGAPQAVAGRRQSPVHPTGGD